MYIFTKVLLRIPKSKFAKYNLELYSSLIPCITLYHLEQNVYTSKVTYSEHLVLLCWVRV
jgi:hypothetical protein